MFWSNREIWAFVRIFIRTSKWAIWARRLGSLALPLTLLPVLLHRARLIESPAFFGVALVAAAVSALAILVALVALVRLWQRGDQGWGRALMGLFLGLCCLAPFAWYGALALHYPVVTDIATTSRDALPLVFEPDTAAMPPPRLATEAERERFFPNVATRTYPLGAGQLFALVDNLVAARGWDVRLRREPDGLGGAGRLNARILTLPGWREEAVFRVAPLGEDATVDMRSASLNAVTDFGSNGERISAFLVALDNEVTAFLRDNPNIDQPLDADAPEPVETGN